MELLNLLNPISSVEKFLEWNKRPRPVIKFECKTEKVSENDYCHYRFNISVQRNAWFFRLGIDNLGKTPIQNADVRVEKVEKVFPKERVPISRTPFFLHWANENTDNSRMIYPNTPVYIDVVFMNEGQKQIFIFYKHKHEEAGIKNNLAPGKYLITIKLLGENISPLEQQLIVESNGDWKKLNMYLLSERSPRPHCVEKIINNKQKTHRWWEKTWFQIIALLGAVAGIFGFVFLFLPPKDLLAPPLLVGKDINVSNVIGNQVLQASGFSISGYQLLDLSSTTIHTLLDNVRKEHKVRQLLSLESGKKLSDIPDFTYSFLSPVYFDILQATGDDTVLKSKVDRFDSFWGGYFEVHKVSNDEIYLLGFVSEETFANVNNKNLSGLVLFPSPDSDRKYLLVLPLSEVKESEDREITLDTGRNIRVLDISLKELH